jgi:hypothetical protein
MTFIQDCKDSLKRMTGMRLKLPTKGSVKGFPKILQEELDNFGISILYDDCSCRYQDGGFLGKDSVFLKLKAKRYDFKERKRIVFHIDADSIRKPAWTFSDGSTQHDGTYFFDEECLSEKSFLKYHNRIKPDNIDVWIAWAIYRILRR